MGNHFGLCIPKRPRRRTLSRGYRSFISHDALTPDNMRKQRQCRPALRRSSPRRQVLKHTSGSGGAGGSGSGKKNLPDIAITLADGRRMALDENDNMVELDTTWSPLSDSDLSQVKNLTLWDYLQTSEWRDNQTVAIINGITNTLLTYEELLERVDKISLGLLNIGVTHAHSVCIIAYNCPDVIATFLAAARLGITVCMIDPSQTPDYVASLLEAWKPQVVITCSKHLPSARQLAKTSPIMVYELSSSSRSARSLESMFLADPEDSFSLGCMQASPDDVLLQLANGDSCHSVATNAIRLTHQNIVSNLEQIRVSEMGSIWSEVVQGVIPFHHPRGLIGVACTVLAQLGTLVTCPRWDVRDVMHAAQEYQVSTLPMLSGWPGALVSHPLAKASTYFPRDIVVFTSGHFPYCRHAEKLEKAGIEQVFTVYGLCEAGVCIAYSVRTWMQKGRGTLLPGTNVRIVDPLSGRILEHSEEGEVCVKGPQVMSSAVNNDILTAGVLDQEGWLRTGDLGFLYADGSLCVINAIDDVIGIENRAVYLRKIERLVRRHGVVQEAAVVAAPKLAALVVAKEEPSDGSADAILMYVNKNLPLYCQVKSLTFVKQLPKTGSGRIIRRAVAKHIQPERTS